MTVKIVIVTSRALTAQDLRPERYIAAALRQDPKYRALQEEARAAREAVQATQSEEHLCGVR